VPRRPAHDKTKAHGKKFICRVLANKTHGKLNTHVKTPSLPSVYFMAHGKEAVRGGMSRGPCICRVHHCGTRQTQIFAVCFFFLPCALITAHGKSFKFFLILHSIFFVVSTDFTWDSKLSFCIFSANLVYITTLFHIKDLLGINQILTASIISNVT